MAPLTPVAIDTVDLRIISLIDQRFWETGLIATPEKIAEDLHVELQIVQASLKKPAVVDNLKSRGIDLLGYDSSSKVLTPTQVVLANLLMNVHDPATLREKLKLVHVSLQQYNAWLRQPAFSAYLRARAETQFGANDFTAFNRLTELVEAGDLGAIKMFLEMRGAYQPVSRSTAQVDVHVILNQVIEAVGRHVSNPVALVQIAEELEAVTRGANRGSVNTALDVPSRESRALETGTIFTLNAESVKNAYASTLPADATGVGEALSATEFEAMRGSSPDLMSKVLSGEVKKSAGVDVSVPAAIRELFERANRVVEGPVTGAEKQPKGIAPDAGGLAP